MDAGAAVARSLVYANVQSFQRMSLRLAVAVTVINERITAQNIIYFGWPAHASTHRL